MSFWTDLKQRLLKWETIHGLYFIPLGIVGIWITLFHLEYVIHALAALVFLYAIVEGVYKIFHNPIKKQAAINTAVQQLTKTN